MLTCSLCDAPFILYWLKDCVWKNATPMATGPAGHLCLQCAERVIGRAITLHDLEISNYLRTAKNMGMGFMRQNVRATIIGACEAVDAQIPEGWTEPTFGPHIDARRIGAQLARQTSDAKAFLPELVAEVHRRFPDQPVEESSVLKQHEIQWLRSFGVTFGRMTAQTTVAAEELENIVDGLRQPHGANAAAAVKFIDRLFDHLVMGQWTYLKDGPGAKWIREGLKEGVQQAWADRG